MRLVMCLGVGRGIGFRRGGEEWAWWGGREDCIIVSVSYR
jgi:hypothetical protein